MLVTNSSNIGTSKLQHAGTNSSYIAYQLVATSWYAIVATLVASCWYQCCNYCVTAIVATLVPMLLLAAVAVAVPMLLHCVPAVAVAGTNSSNIGTSNSNMQVPIVATIATSNVAVAIVPMLLLLHVALAGTNSCYYCVPATATSYSCNWYQCCYSNAIVATLVPATSNCSYYQ